AEALSLCNRFEPLLHALGTRGCADCAKGGERGLFAAMEEAYACARDPEAVLHALGSAKTTLLGARAALRIAARYALVDPPSPWPPPPRLQPLHPCPAALRAIAKLRGRAPKLDTEPDMLAAILRQSASVPSTGKLPVPSLSPFEELGDLLAQLDLADIVAP